MEGKIVVASTQVEQAASSSDMCTDCGERLSEYNVLHKQTRCWFCANGMERPAVDSPEATLVTNCTVCNSALDDFHIAQKHDKCPECFKNTQAPPVKPHWQCQFDDCHVKKYQVGKNPNGFCREHLALDMMKWATTEIQPLRVRESEICGVLEQILREAEDLFDDEELEQSIEAMARFVTIYDQHLESLAAAQRQIEAREYFFREFGRWYNDWVFLDLDNTHNPDRLSQESKEKFDLVIRAILAEDYPEALAAMNQMVQIIQSEDEDERQRVEERRLAVQQQREQERAAEEERRVQAQREQRRGFRRALRNAFMGGDDD